MPFQYGCSLRYKVQILANQQILIQKQLLIYCEKSTQTLKQIYLKINQRGFMIESGHEKSSSVEIIEHDPIKQRYRFVNLAFFILAAFLNDSPINCLASIGSHTAQLYEVSETIIVVCGLLNMLLFPFIFIPIQHILDKFQFKTATLIGQSFLIFGAIIRLFLYKSFTYYFIGTFFCAFGCLMFVSSINKFISTWFPYQEIPLVSSCMWMVALNSGPLSTILTGAILGDNSTKQDFQSYFTWHSIIIISIQVIMMIFLKGKPKIPFNHFALVERQSYRTSCKTLFKRRSFVLTIISGCCFFGYSLAVLTTLSWLLKIYGMGAEKYIVYILLNQGFGSLGTVILGFIIKKNKQYKRVIFMCSVATTVALSLTFIFLQFGAYYPSLFFAGITGFFGFPVITLSFDFCTQLAYPVSQNVSTGFLNLFEDTFAFAFAFILSFLFDGQNILTTRIGMILIVLTAVIGSTLFYFTKNDLLRTKYQEDKIKEQQGTLTNGIQQSLLSEQKEN